MKRVSSFGLSIVYSIAIAILIASFFFVFAVQSPQNSRAEDQTPSEAKIMALKLFEEPMIPISGRPSEAENQELIKAINDCDVKGENFLPIEDFLAKNSKSAWRGSLLTNLGLTYFSQGYYSKALGVYEKAWDALKEEKPGTGKAFADRALGEWLMLLARLGRKEQLENIFTQIRGRELTGVASERVTAAREGLTQMQTHPESSYLCGPYALMEVAAKVGFAKPETILTLASTHKGTSLFQIHKLAQQHGLKFKMVFRNPQSEVLFPAVMHWKSGHFAPILKQQDDRYLVKDITFLQNANWVSRKALEEESSGYAIVPDGPLPDGWREVDEDEAQLIWGKGRTSDSDPSQTAEDEVAVGGSCSTGMGTAPQWKGMAQYKIQLALVSLSIVDIPVGYEPPVGYPINCKILYSQREDGQPTVFPFSNFGQKWNFSFLAYVTDRPTALTSAFTVFLRGGGSEVHDMDGSAEVSDYRNIQTRARMVRKSRVPIVYERELPDGSKEVYSESDGSTGTTRRIFLKQVVDPQGNAITLNYDRTSTGGIRLVSIVDAIGQRTTLSYELPSDPLKITKITDPFGRSATFTYTNGKLIKITDVIGLSSEFGYLGNEDFISTLKTPYETTTFRKLDPTSSNRTYRWLEATDSINRTERVEFRHSAPGMTDKDPTLDETFKLNDRLYFRNSFYWDKEAYRLHVKGKDLDDPKTTAYVNAKIFHFYHTTQNITSGIIESIKTPLEGRVFFLLSNTRRSDITFMTTETIGNAPSAVIRWLDNNVSEEGRITTRNNLGYVLEDIDAVGRATKYTYDSNDINVLKVERGEAAVESGEVVFKNLQTVLSLSDYVKYRPQVVRDASGRTSRLKYNDRGQIETITNAKSEVTTIKYSPQGYIERIVSPDPQANTSFSYDGKGRIRTTTNSEGYVTTYDYDDLDRLRKVTYQDGTYEEFGYNRLDLETYRDRQGRITARKYNAWRQLEEVVDANSQKTSFSWCGCGSPETVVDAKGQKTQFVRDIQGRIKKKIFDDGSTINYEYERNTNRLKSLVYPNGQSTNYEYFEDGNIKTIRNARSIYSDREPIRRGGGRRITSNRATFTANEDEKSDEDQVQAKRFRLAEYVGADTGASSEALIGPNEGQQAVTPLLTSFTYDPVFNRVKSMLDETGTTVYEYHPVDGVTLGAGLLKSIDGPLSNDTITYAYDELGRVQKRTLNGASIEAEYDILGRLWKENNSLLGNFLYDYVPGTGRIKSITRGNGGFARNFDYFTYPAEPRLKTLTNKWGASIASKYDYTYYDAGAIKSWTFGDSAKIEFGYDSIDQLRSVDIKSGTGVTVLGYSYEYDKAGNRTKETPPGTRKEFSPNNLNQITNTKEFSASSGTLLNEKRLSYDENGNLKEIVPISGGGVSTKYEWDAFNRLITIHHSATRQTRITYDGLNRWTKIVETDSGLTTSSKQFIWCGLSLCEERSSRGVKRFFPQGFIDYDGRSYFYGRDHLGSVRELFNSNGAVVAIYQYDLYGNRSTIVQNGAGADFGFTGHYFHEPSRLHLAPFRAYSAELGRWVNRDPIGESGGLNLYGYVRNNPSNLIDQYGHEAIDIRIILGGGISIGEILTGVGVGITGPGVIIAGGIVVTGIGVYELYNHYNQSSDGESGSGEQGCDSSNPPINIGDKIRGQMGGRGWSPELISDTVKNPSETKPVRDQRHSPQGPRNDQPATAYIRPDGSYVVVNDVTGDVVQVSDRNKPGWKPPF